MTQLPTKTLNTEQPTPKTQARLVILSRLLSCPTITSRWSNASATNKPVVGDLVSLSCAPPSKYYLSWLRDFDLKNDWPRYLLESIEDGELSWWSNVNISIYSREIACNPSWQWDDEQFAFNNRWLQVCRDNNAYDILGCEPVFNNKTVLLTTRIRWTQNKSARLFPNWKTVTNTQMDDWYKECKQQYVST